MVLVSVPKPEVWNKVVGTQGYWYLEQLPSVSDVNVNEVQKANEVTPKLNLVYSNVLLILWLFQVI